MNNKNIDKVIRILKKEFPKYRVPIVTEVSYRRDPFQVLVSCILSLRTKDETTTKASQRLFKLAKTPKSMQKLTIKQIQKAIYPVGFYITKAKRIKEICKILNEKYKGKVPDEIDELLKLKGVGRKTANLTVGVGYGKPAICVDAHVHVLSNRLGWVNTKTAEQTEFALRKILPKKYWIVINDLFVAYGQNVCLTAYPKCGKCVIERFCKYNNKNLNRT